MSPTPSTSGWPFAVARGRTVGYRAILAPAFLIAAEGEGLLTAGVKGEVAPSGPPRVEEVTTPRGDRLTLVYRTHRLLLGDLAQHPDRDDEEVRRHIATDQHGRPLDLFYGFVAEAGPVGEVDERDLQRALDEALQAYRTFRSDEDGSAPQASEAGVLHTATRGGARAVPRPEAPAIVPVATRGEALADVALAAVPDPALSPRPSSTGLGLLVAALVVTVTAIAVLQLRGPSGPELTYPEQAVPCDVQADGRYACTVTLELTGVDSPLPLGQVRVVQEPGDALLASSLLHNACEARVDPGATCEVRVAFVPPDGLILDEGATLRVQGGTIDTAEPGTVSLRVGRIPGPER